jgi:hypothetical protein
MFSVADLDPGSGAFLIPGSGIWCLLTPGSGDFLTPGSRIGKKSESGSGIRVRDELSGSYFRELRNNVLG